MRTQLKSGLKKSLFQHKKPTLHKIKQVWASKFRMHFLCKKVCNIEKKNPGNIINFIYNTHE